MNNDIWAELLAKRGEVQAEIGAGGNENAKLRVLNEWLGRELDLEARYSGLLAEAEGLVSERRRPTSSASKPVDQHQPDTEVQEGWTFADVPKQQRAELARRAFFLSERRNNKSYTRVGRIYYRGADGTVAGITFSSEAAGTWFLNLLADKFQEAILLCQVGPRSVRVIRLPQEFLARYKKQLSRDGKGEVKFNFVRREARWFMDVPQPVGQVEVTSYVSPNELNCERIVYA